MNKGFEQKVNDYIIDYLDGDDEGKEYVLHCARHFYNLAMDDMLRAINNFRFEN